MLPLLESSECFALQLEHKGKFLQSVYHKTDGGSRIEASADTTAGNARTRFFLEPSEEHEGLVHIRYCYNNKYWVPVQDSGNAQFYISAADGPEEDLKSLSCTLFKPISDASKGDNNIRIQVSGHRYGNYATVLTKPDVTRHYLQLSDDEEYFLIIGLPRGKELPKYVAFKGDNGTYLRAEYTHIFPSWSPIRLFFGKQFLYFGTQDIGSDMVICTVTTNDDGTIQIKSNKTWIWCTYKANFIVPIECDRYDRYTAFKVITGDGFIALQNMGNQRFCNRVYIPFTESLPLDGLCAEETSISKTGRLVLEEAVLRREISDLKFHLEQARIHSSSLVSLKTREYKNDTPEVLTGTFSFKKKTEVSGTWETIVSTKTTELQKFSARIGEVPIVIGAEVTLSSEAASSKRRTESTRSSEERTIRQDFTVPPGKTVTAEFVAMQASCDVPYSYKQRDVLTTGETILKVCEDGIYTSVNKYKFQIIMTES